MCVRAYGWLFVHLLSLKGDPDFTAKLSKLMNGVGTMLIHSYHK